MCCRVEVPVLKSLSKEDSNCSPTVRLFDRRRIVGKDAGCNPS
jgi:hypothetical protein